MTPGARLSAAIEILAEVLDRHHPAADALHDWGRSHRFAGSGDRAAINSLVNAALRRRFSSAFMMGEETPRALALGALKLSWQQSTGAISAIIAGDPHAPPPLSEAEAALLDAPERLAGAPDFVRGDYPEWLAGAFAEAFGGNAAAEGAALAGRAPLDLRVNTLKTTREKVAKALAHHGVAPTPWSPVGLRIALAEGPARLPHVESDPTHGRGHFEVQDEGSQVAALLAGAKPGMQVIDYCAGAGGKTLAIAATMINKGQIYAHDSDERRLRPIFERLRRAGARNVQPRTARDGLADLEGKADLVLVDAPCSGSGVWRRRPDAKWRLTRQQLDAREAEQAAILAEAAPYVRQGGRLAYVTCSVLRSENYKQVEWFIRKNEDFRLEAWGTAWADGPGTTLPVSADGSTETLQLTPRAHATDGFFVALMRRR